MVSENNDSVPFFFLRTNLGSVARPVRKGAVRELITDIFSRGGPIEVLRSVIGAISIFMSRVVLYRWWSAVERFTDQPGNWFANSVIPHLPYWEQANLYGRVSAANYYHCRFETWLERHVVFCWGRSPDATMRTSLIIGE